MTQLLWVFGNAVQDITVEVDLERLAREHHNIRELFRLNVAPEIKKDVEHMAKVDATMHRLDPASTEPSARAVRIS